MNKKYCLKNIKGIKLLKICTNDKIIITDEQFKRGYRISSNTLKINNGMGAVQCYITNEYNFIKKQDSTNDNSKLTVIFVYDALIQNTTMNTIRSNRMNMSINLSMIIIKKDNKIIQNYFIIDQMDKVKDQINKSILPILRDFSYFEMDLLDMFGIGSERIIKRIAYNVLNNKSINEKINEVNIENVGKSISIQIYKR